MYRRIPKSRKGRHTEARLRPIRRDGSIVEYELSSNGLRVLYARVPQSATVTTCIVYTVGSRHEASGETGLAHMLEHMLFKDTGTKGPTWKTLEERGAVLNATTWLDRTTYYFNMPKEYLSDMLLVEADRMRNVRLTKRQFEPERASVLSEYEMNYGDPETVLEWNVFDAAFLSHGYKHDTIGYRTDIESYTPTKLQAFYDKHYWPENATLIISGDISQHTLCEAVERAFGHISRAPKAHIKAEVTEGEQHEERRVTLVRDTPIRTLTLAYKAPQFQSREWIALSLALTHLTDGKTSVLYRALVDTNLATSVSGSLYPTHDPFLALFTITVSARTAYEKVEKIVKREVLRIAKKLLSSKRVRELVTHAHASETFSRDGTMEVATQIAEYVATGDWRWYEKSLMALTRVTPSEIRDAAAAYLDPTRVTIGVIEKPS